MAIQLMTKSLGACRNRIFHKYTNQINTSNKNYRARLIMDDHSCHTSMPIMEIRKNNHAWELKQ